MDWYNKFNVDLALIYFLEPDNTGHGYGSESAEYAYMVSLRELCQFVYIIIIRVGIL
jgi:hypothetical protein